MIAAALVIASALATIDGGNAFLEAHALETAGNHAQAIHAYEACANATESLRPYALLGAARCRAVAGDTANGAAGLRHIIDQFAQSPCARVARIELAGLLRKQQQFAQAELLFSAALQLKAIPWWLEPAAATAAENLIDAGRPEGFAHFRTVVDQTYLQRPRLDAARMLMRSSDSADRAWAVYGLLRSGTLTDAGAALLATPLPALATDAAPFSLDALGRIALEAQNAPESETVLRLVKANGDSRWLPLWLWYGVKSYTAARKEADAARLCDILARHFPGTMETAEALNTLALHLAKIDEPLRAADVHLRLAEVCPEHFRADDSLYYAGDLLLANGKQDEAQTVWMRLGKDYPASRFAAQALYRAGVLRDANGERLPALMFFAKAAQVGVGDFYAHRAFDRLSEAGPVSGLPHKNLRVDGRTTVLRPFNLVEDAPPELPDSFATDPRIQRMRFFAEHGLDEGEWEALELIESAATAPDANLYYRAAAECGYAYSVWRHTAGLDWGMADGKPSIERLWVDYPRAYWSLARATAEKVGLDPYLLLAVMRQESGFRAAVVSHAGATGLMQVMPNTAKWLAKVEPAITPGDAARLTDPAASLRMGAYYLLRMIERSGGNLVYALASYNAGPGNCDKWRRSFGNFELDDFIEAIPFDETRGYVKKVLANYAAYHSLYPDAA